MMKNKTINNKITPILFILLTSSSQIAFSADLSGLWQSIDDKTGNVKTTIEIQPDAQGIYTGTIKTISPRVGSKLQETCINCPAPYTNQRLVGLKTITGLKHVSGNDYAEGQILDPISGKQANLKAKLSTSGNRLNLQGFTNNIAGRTQAWIRVK